MGILDSYIPLVEFLGQALGKHCEVVLHDLTNAEHSIVAIANGHLSGRKVGGPATDFVLKLMQQEKQEQAQFVVDYHGKASNGHIFRSSSYFIKDADGTVVGVLCLNYDVQPYLDARAMIDENILHGLHVDDFAPQEPVPRQPVKAVETLYKTAGDTSTNMIAKRLAAYPVAPDRLSMDERVQLIENLNQDGLFLLKGGIPILAETLGVSEPTIYRYLNRIRH